MIFRNREAVRQYRDRHAFFSPAACKSLERDQHHFDAGFEHENIYDGFRGEALTFFKGRNIKWHGQGSCDTSIVSSQVACLNSFFAFVNDPCALGRWLSTLYPDLQSVLPIDASSEPAHLSGEKPFVTFEWIGTRNYLGERWGRRGQNCTSVDVLFRFRTISGQIHLVLAEWKYCERYEDKSKYICFSDRGTDRVAIYRPHHERAGSQLQLGRTAFEDLFFEPFDQLMRLQLLASAMEKERELDADIVSVLHLSPRANEGLVNNALSAKVATGSTLGEVWGKIVAPGRFKSVAVEDLIPLLADSTSHRNWSGYIKRRYGGMV